MNRKLLSIAIPTWNRAKTLEEALLRILPQARSWSDHIQLVISDNASSDHTAEVVRGFIVKYPEVEIEYFVQETNTGFFGNFCKVKQLSSAKYIWMLSDDDFIDEKLIERIINTLSAQNDLGILFLHNWIIKDTLKFYIKKESVENIFIQENYRLTLISSAIFINDKRNEQFLFNRFKSSNFIGFMFLVDALKDKQNGAVLFGNSINVGMDAPKGYNWFQAFIIDINVALEYMFEIGYSNNVTVAIRNNILKKLIIFRYRLVKAYSKLDGGLETWDLKRINKLIFNYYIKDIKTFFIFIPSYLMPPIFLRVFYNLKAQLKNRVGTRLKTLINNK
jgi:glycosyltransferase involved in cell wall biosynthesis